MTNFVRPEMWPPVHAQKAYDAGFHIEALQTLHGWIEIRLRDLLLLRGASAESWPRRWDASNELSLSAASRALFVAGFIDEAMFAKIGSFNRVRNNLVHKLYYQPYEKEYDGVPREEYDAAFASGLSLGHDLEEMVDILSSK